MLQRFLDPSVLAGISGLDLVAKTVVDGFISGLHRSPDFGFSQEFAEYRAYNPGDDLRHVDWNVFARSEKMFLKRYRGETNCQVSILLDASRSMKYRLAWDGEDGVREISRRLYLLPGASAARRGGTDRVRQRGAAIRATVDPSGPDHADCCTRIDQAQTGAETVLEKPFAHLVDYLRRRGVVVAISDFWENPETVIKTVGPLRSRGNELILFHVLDPQEIQPKLRGPVLLEDLESGAKMEVSPDYVTHEYQGQNERASGRYEEPRRRRRHRLFPGGHQPSAG